MSWPDSGSATSATSGRGPRARSTARSSGWPPWGWSRPSARTSGNGRGRWPRSPEGGRRAGRQLRREWRATPVSPFAMDFEAMIRLFIAPLGTKEQLVATLQQVRDDAQEMLRFSGAVKQEFLDVRAALQDQVYLRALAVDFFISLLN